MVQKGKWASKLTSLTDLPEEIAAILPLVEIAGNKRVLVEHHCGVIAYGKEEIIVQVKKGSVVISGENLLLTKMTATQLIISGKIYSVHLEG